METGLTDEEIAKARDGRLQLERDDYNNAIAGRETGRMVRFGAKSKAQTEADQRKAERVFRDALDRLLADPEYRALYEQLGERLDDAERAADQMLAEIQAALDAIDEQIADMEARAARGPDGQVVFRTADGRVVNASGEELPPEIADGIIWPPNAPSAEDYFRTRERRSDLASQLEDWQSFRNDTLGDLRDRYDDRDNPMSKDDLRDALDAIEQSTPTISGLSIEPAAAEEQPGVQATAQAIPTSLR